MGTINQAIHVYLIILTTTTCGVGQYYSGNTCYSCLSAPSNAYYTTQGTCDWTCNSGYYKSGNVCVSNYNYNNNYYNSCSRTILVKQYMLHVWISLANAYYTTQGTCDWNCNSGFYKSNGVCVSNNNNNYNNCGVGQYYSNGTCYSCGTVPYNGYYSTLDHVLSHVTLVTTTILLRILVWVIITIITTLVVCWPVLLWKYVLLLYTNHRILTIQQPAAVAGHVIVDTTQMEHSVFQTQTCGVGQYWAGNGCVSCCHKTIRILTIQRPIPCNWTCNSGYYRSGGFMCQQLQQLQQLWW